MSLQLPLTAFPKQRAAALKASASSRRQREGCFRQKRQVPLGLCTAGPGTGTSGGWERLGKGFAPLPAMLGCGVSGVAHPVQYGPYRESLRQQGELGGPVRPRTDGRTRGWALAE